MGWDEMREVASSPNSVAEDGKRDNWWRSSRRRLGEGEERDPIAHLHGSIISLLNSLFTQALISLGLHLINSKFYFTSTQPERLHA